VIEAFKIITLFPELFTPILKTAVFERGSKKLNIEIINLREFTEDKRRTVDDTPYGGGCGMVLKPEPLSKALLGVSKNKRARRKVIYLTPQGGVFDQEYAMRLLKEKEIVLVCGRYEGVDQRFIDMYVDEELSIGDYVLSGGELAAMVVMESVIRLIPGVLGNEDSVKTDSFSDGLLEYPQYTRPIEFNGKKVPAVLASGDHEKIRQWRRAKALSKTRKARPDLFEKVSLTEADKKLLKLR
jgi:tRNA (guanine37-N1)-methyltransferase